MSTDPARLLFITSGLSTGGAEMMLYKLMQGLDRQRFTPAVISLRDVGEIGRAIVATGTPVEALNIRRALPGPLAVAQMVRTVRQFQPHLIQGWMYHGNLAALAARGRGAQPVCWGIRSCMMGEGEAKRSTMVTIRLGARASTRVARIVYNAEVSRAGHEAAGYHRARGQVIANGFDVTRFAPDGDAVASVRAELGIPADAPLIGLVARYDVVKDHRTFLHAAAALRVAGPAPHFLLVGDGVTPDQTALARLCADEGIGERVHLLGYRTDIPRLTAALDVATLCSAWGEAFPNAVGEAMACGVPCVVTDVGDGPRIVGDTGRTVPVRDVAALAAAWAELLGMPSERRRAMGAAARQRVVERYDLATVTRAYEDLYSSLLARPTPSGAV